MLERADAGDTGAALQTRETGEDSLDLLTPTRGPLKTFKQ